MLGDIDNLDQAKDIEQHQSVNINFPEIAVVGDMSTGVRRATTVLVVVSARLTLYLMVISDNLPLPIESGLIQSVSVIFGRACCNRLEVGTRFYFCWRDIQMTKLML